MIVGPVNSLRPNGPLALPGFQIAPVGGKILYVHSSGAAALDELPDGMDDYVFTTLNSALAQTRENRGDTVLLLPGHVETISSADQMTNLKASTNIYGLGCGNQRAILRWTAAAATFLLDKDGVVIANTRMQMAGNPAATTALTVAAPMTISGAGCALLYNDIDVGVDGDQIVTVAITTTAAADGLEIAYNTIHGEPAAEITAAGTVIRLVGADRARIHHNNIAAALATDTDGLIEFLTTASLNVEISDNYLHSNGASSDTCIDGGANLACTGWLIRNFCRNMTDANTNWIVTSGTGMDLQLQDNYGINNNNERGLAIGTASV